MVELMNAYYRLCEQNHWKIDGAQEAALSLLEQTLDQPKPRIKRLFSPWAKKSPGQGVYLYGDVGRGKTMVMNLFYEHATSVKKRRWHFTEFMTMIHHRLKKAAQHAKPRQPIEDVIDGLSQEVSLICLDEFQVTEIADAMILSRLFSGLWQKGIDVVLTSNLAPDELYLGGLHYDRFYPFVAFLLSQFNIFHLNNEANRDYRRLSCHPQQCYFKKNDSRAYEKCEELFIQLTGTAVFHPSTLHVHHREIVLPRTAKKSVWIPFQELCGMPLGPSDYLMLAKGYNVLFLIDVPIFTIELKNEARRFISLIDVWYDQKKLLVMVMDTELENLFQFEDSAIPYPRTLSRLQEMQTLPYWQGPTIQEG